MTGEAQLDSTIQQMAAWDGKLNHESAEAAVYEVFTRKLLNSLLADLLGDLTIRYQGKGPVPLLAEGSLFGERWLGWLTTMLGENAPDNTLLGVGEKRNQVLTNTLKDTLRELAEIAAPNASEWSWGKLHRIAFLHSLGSAPLLHPIFDRGPYPLGGDSTTIWAAGASSTDFNIEKVVGPPYRMIVDLGDFRRSVSLLAPGQSGSPTSPHYDDQLQAWFSAGYHPMLFDRQDIEKQTLHLLELTP
jgi:penicillin amidase